MKKIFGCIFITLLVISIIGCGGGSGPTKSLRIVGGGGSSGLSSLAFHAQAEGGYVMREYYYYSYPIDGMCGQYYLEAIDQSGNPIVSGINWSLNDDNFGTLTPVAYPVEYMMIFTPSKIGQCTVSATNGESIDTAQIVIFPSFSIFQATGLNLENKSIVFDENQADIWIPFGGTHVVFEGGYSNIDPLGELSDYDHLAALNGSEGTFNGDTVFAFDGSPRLFLIKSRSGATYGVLNVGNYKFCYRKISD